MKRILLVGCFFLLLSVGVVFLPGDELVQAGQIFDIAPKSTPPPPVSVEEVDAVVEVILLAMQDRAHDQPVFWLADQRVENVILSPDRKWASAWLVPIDQVTGVAIETEPGLALLQRSGGSWQVAFPGDLNWLAWLNELPKDALGEGGKEYWLEVYTQAQTEAVTAPLSGYLLPWERGVTGNMTGSYLHDGYITNCSSHYAFDFTITDPSTGYGGLFTILAAKGGTVWKFRDDYPKNDHTGEGNYIVLKDTTTVPVTYQLYLHLVPASIPAAIRWVGAPVHQGQIIGVADNTGASTGNHLHFMVHTNAYSYWGTSVDITFTDVDINGGRPRIRWFINDPYWDDSLYCKKDPCNYSTDVCDNYRNTYVSGNTLWDDFTGPTGGLITPTDFAAFTTNALSFSGWAEDNGSGIKSAQLLAAWNGTYTPVGQVFSTTSFSGSWDMCASQVPNGAISLGLKLTDWKGNVSTLTGLRTVLKDTTCPPPADTCPVTADQVALFAEPNYRGACQVFAVGTHDVSVLTVIGNDNAASVKVGANMRATLSYNAVSNTKFDLRAETLSKSDTNLSDNAIQSDTTSALKVMAKSSLPVVPLPAFPASGSVLQQTQSFTLYWIDQGGAEQFQAELKLVGGAQIYTSPWQTHSFWSLGSSPGSTHLPVGTYEWRVRAKNSMAGESAWSSPVTFTIAAYTPPASTPITVPFTHSMNGGDGWIGTGLWHLVNEQPYVWWYGQGAAGSENYEGTSSGDLTSPPFVPGAASYLRIQYRHQTETQGKFWDQRWIQVSVDGGPFTNLNQFSEDLMIVNDPNMPWLTSPVINLSGYAGHTIRLRLHFDTIYPYNWNLTNNYQGWFIDEVSVTSSPPVSCPFESGEPNDSIQAAAQLVYSTTPVSAAICPGGDLDFYSFFGNGTDRVVVDINTEETSLLDGVLYLLDSDGSSILAENDDEDYPDNLDPYLSFLLPRSDTYYLKLKAWDHPLGGAAYSYDMQLINDINPPALSILFPKQGETITQTVTLSASASDSGSGMASVTFYLHDNDWSDPVWVSLGSDQDGLDGWRVSPDLSWLSDQSNAGVMAIAQDKAGNTKAVWEIGVRVDRTPPVTWISIVNGAPAQSAGIPIAYTLETNAFRLGWTGSDAFSGLDHFDLQHSLDLGAWLDYLTDLPPNATSTVVIAPASSVLHTYSYRVRGVDTVGNIEPYPLSDADIIIPSDDVLCSAPDTFEIDNDSITASSFDLAAGIQRHNLCKTDGVSFQGDVDWVSVNLSAGTTYFIQVLPEASIVAVETILYASDAETEIKRYTPQVFGEPVVMTYTPAVDETVYLRMNHINSQVIGNAAGYMLMISDKFKGSIFPLVFKNYSP